MVNLEKLVYPLFVKDGFGIREEIPSMPGIHRFSSDELLKEIEELKSIGISNILLFGIADEKDNEASGAYKSGNVIENAILLIKNNFPTLTVMTDVCLCAYTLSGHCAILKPGYSEDVDNEFIDLDKSLSVLSKIALSHAKAGADYVAPSAVLKGQVGTIRNTLNKNGYINTKIMGYSAKFASSFYGPFRDAALSAPKFGNRNGYQLDFAKTKPALEKIESDLKEGADIVRAIDGYIDFILIDSDHRKARLKRLEDTVRKTVTKSIVLTYKDTDAQVNAVDALVAQLLGEKDNPNIVILGNNYMAEDLNFKLSTRGKKIRRVSYGSKNKRWIDAIIGVSPFQPVVDLTILKQLKKNGIIIDAGPRSIFPDAIDSAHNMNIPIYRVDMRAGLSGEIIDVLETYELRNKIMGHKEMAGVGVVAGGILGKRGDVVLDAIANPTRVIGVVDGKGQLIKKDELGPYVKDIKKVKQEITRQRFSNGYNATR